jgi:hypothetical protein
LTTGASLVTAIRQLEPDARSEIAKALMETELDARLTELIKSLASRPAADDVTDRDLTFKVERGTLGLQF